MRTGQLETVRSEGGLLPGDLLLRVREGDRELGGLRGEDYGLTANEPLNEAIVRSWNRLVGAWAMFAQAWEALPAGDPGTTVARQRWLLPLLQELGYGRLQTVNAAEIESRSYPVSHGWGVPSPYVPIHLVGCNVRLDTRSRGVAGAATQSPHGIVQELLNRSDERLWGIVSNGLQLRLLRDNSSLTRQAFVEFDLEAMFQGEDYSDFTLLWLVCHASRVEGGKPHDCWLEKWSQEAVRQGTRALDSLRAGVEAAIVALGSGFIRPGANTALKEALRAGEVTKQDYYRELLRLVYRLLFLFVAEDRQLLHHPDAGDDIRERYAQWYSTGRLRDLAGKRRGTKHTDLWNALHLVMAHLLLQSVSMRCGYPASSIRERIYADAEANHYGLLLYTGSPDAEGTLGGLVNQARHLDDHLAYALRMSSLCSNDPICAQHMPSETLAGRYLVGAACHGCTLVAETSCEMRNDYLDRALVAPVIGLDGAAFFAAIE